MKTIIDDRFIHLFFFKKKWNELTEKNEGEWMKEGGGNGRDEAEKNKRNGRGDVYTEKRPSFFFLFLNTCLAHNFIDEQISCPPSIPPPSLLPSFP